VSSPPPRDVPFQLPETNVVTLGGARRWGWVGLLVAAIGGGFAWRAGDVAASIGCAAFALPGLFLLVAASARYSADDEALYGITMLGRPLRMPWAQVRRVEVGTGGTLVFVGEDARFVVPTPALWSGPHKAVLSRTIQDNVRRLRLTAVATRTADYRVSRNVRVRPDR